MALAGDSSLSPQHMASFKSPSTSPARLVSLSGTFFFIIATIAIFALSRPFQGIDGDARIYIARALADLDPNGVGRDLMFVHDGQSQFSVFSILTDRLVQAFDPGTAAFIFAVTNCICWIAAAQFLIGRFTEGRVKWAILMIAALAPAFYGPFQMLRFAEQYAVPRPLTEACVLMALASVIEERRSLAALFLVVAAALHPIMALPGIIIFGIDLCRSDRRWIFAGLGLGLACLIAAACGLPVFNRLMAPIDPEWLALLRIRNPYLFPALWPFETYGFLALQLATIVFASELVTPRIRFVFWAVVATGLGGLVLASLFGDIWPVLLILQAQLWRTTWLVSAFAAFGLGLCLLNLRREDARFELASALLVLGWFFYDEPIFTITTALIAGVLYGLRHRSLTFGRVALNMIWGLVLLIGLISKYPAVMAFVHYVDTKPADYHATFALFWNIGLLAIPIALFAVAVTHRQGKIASLAIMIFSLTAVFLTARFWDDRQDDRKFIDRGQQFSELAALFPKDHSEIYWMGSTQPWYLLRHPSWALQIQGAGIVFSQPLAMLWQERIKTLMALDLMDGSELRPWSTPVRDEPIQLTSQAVEHICARADAPSTIVAPLEDGEAVPGGLKFKLWQPAIPEYRLSQKDNAVSWHRLSRYAVVSCADHTPERQASVD